MIRNCGDAFDKSHYIHGLIVFPINRDKQTLSLYVYILMVRLSLTLRVKLKLASELVKILSV